MKDNRFFLSILTLISIVILVNILVGWILYYEKVNSSPVSYFVENYNFFKDKIIDKKEVLVDTLLTVNPKTETVTIYSTKPSKYKTGWELYTNVTAGFKFEYPLIINSKYASFSQKPKAIIGTKNINSDGCYLNINPENKFKTSHTTINNLRFCLSVSSEGAAGSSYLTYHYTTPKNGTYITLEYIVRTTNGCGVYIDTPDYQPCVDFRNDYDNIVIKPIQDSVSTLFFTK